jgi:DNA-binding NtrC family response regulator/ligand-binding sensor domain-containing protein
MRDVRLSVLLATLAAATASAQPAPLLQRSDIARAAWTTEQGLPQNTISAILQTRDGYLWLGTLGGLARFDGVRFTVFTAATTPALPSNRVRALAEDREGRLWIGGETGGLVIYDGGRFQPFALNDRVPTGIVQTIHAASDGSIWVGTTNGLARIKDAALSRYTAAEGLPDTDVHAIVETRDGTIWVATRAGVTGFHAERGARTIAAAEGLRDTFTQALMVDRDDVVWAGTRSAIARIIDGRAVAVTDDEGRDVPAVRAFAQDRMATVWAAGSDGVLRAGGAGTLRFHRESRDDTLSLLVDREHTLWVGAGRAGLQRWRTGGITVLSQEPGVADRSVLAVFEDRDGAVWIGGMCGGLTKFGATGATHYGAAEGLRDQCVRSMAQDRDGRIWAGTEGETVHVLEHGRFTAYGPAQGLTGYSVSAILQDRDGTIWVGTTYGLHRFTGGRFVQYGAREGLPIRQVNVIRQDRAGALWIGMIGGLTKLEAGRATTYTKADGLTDDYVREVYEDQDGALWIGTYGGGLVRLKDGRFTAFTQQSGLFDNVVSRILVDDRDRFWMSGNRGVFRVSRADLNAFADGRIRGVTSAAYTVADGMRTSETNGGAQPAGWRTRDGRLWFPTIDGVAVFDPRALDNPLPPPVAIEEVRVNGAPVDPASEITLAAGARSLEVRYTALSFVEPSKVRFRYRLDGVDPAFIDAGNRRTAYYTTVPPGSYRFNVVAANNEGVWNDEGAVMRVVQRPHFYQTFWFAGVVVLSLGAATAGAHRVRTRRLVRRNRELESHVAARTAEVVEQRNELARVNTELARANDDRGAVLDRLRASVMMLDAGGYVTFLNRAALAFLDADAETDIGRPWTDLLPLGDDDRARIAASWAAPVSRRTKIPVRLIRSGRQFWMEVETQDDPRDPSRRILFLYDVSETYDLRRLLDDKAQFHGLVGESRAIQLVFKQIRDVAPVEATVLIEGETGTGKELVARAIHYQSPRRHRPFVAVNCAGLTESLLASQLFGHRRGAFTGAISDQIGLFEAADGGTIFLDEIGDIPVAVQTSLLRVLQEREITRLGEAKPMKVNVRVLAATHRDLSQAAAAGTFRLDLLYRIRVARIPVPPLRERREDIPLLVSWLLGQARGATHRHVEDISRDAMDALVRYDWPGNVRELKSAIESAVIGCATTVVQIGDLPRDVAAAVGAALSPDERQRILEALARTEGNRAAAARLLGMGRTTLYRRLKELGIETDDPSGV